MWANALFLPIMAMPMPTTLSHGMTSNSTTGKIMNHVFQNFGHGMQKHLHIVQKNLITHFKVLKISTFIHVLWFILTYICVIYWLLDCCSQILNGLHLIFWHSFIPWISYIWENIVVLTTVTFSTPFVFKIPGH